LQTLTYFGIGEAVPGSGHGDFQIRRAVTGEFAIMPGTR
jgi:hypothetical protein